MVERNQSFVFGILFCELGPVVSEDFYLVALIHMMLPIRTVWCESGANGSL